MADKSFDQMVRAMRSPLGDSYSSAAERDGSVAGQMGATNLLMKAVAAIEVGDRDRSTQLVARALALPFDSFEQCVPAVVAAEMLLFNLMTDELEDSDDEGWLDAAVDVLDEVSEAAATDVKHILALIGDEYLLNRYEARRVRQVLVGHLEPMEVRDIVAGATALAPRILALLEAFSAYRRALGRDRES